LSRECEEDFYNSSYFLKGPMDVITPAADAIIVQLKLVSSKNNLFMTRIKKISNLYEFPLLAMRKQNYLAGVDRVIDIK